MSAISVETKKFSELQEITSAPAGSEILIHDGNGVKVISATNFKKDLSAIIDPLTYTGAGAHNSIYRGKSLGTSVTSEQYANIRNGTFKDMYIGDYWTVNGKVYRIAAFDYYYHCGESDLPTHHVTLVPDKALYTAQMHNTNSGEYESGAANTTEGGYVGSDMYTTNLESAKTTIAAAFGSHLLEHKQFLVNAVTSGRPSGAAWFDSKVELMNEIMVYGTNVFSPVSDGSTVPLNYTVNKTQLPLFALRPDAINFREGYWLRDVISAADFAYVSLTGRANYYYASQPLGVRPAFSIS